MKQRAIVCIVSGQTIPNYIFIKEMYLPGDNVILITTKGTMEENAKHIINTINMPSNWPNLMVDTLTFERKGDEWDWSLLNEKMRKWFPDDSNTVYVANITGGTKLMSMALYLRMIELKSSEIYYMPDTNDNRIDLLSPLFRNIFSGVKVNPIEYMKLYGQSNLKYSTPKFDYETCDKVFHGWKTQEDFSEIRMFLQLMRGHNVYICPSNDNERDAFEKYSVNGKKVDMNRLEEYLSDIGYDRKAPNKIDKNEVDFITGGWFEDWTYYFIKKSFGLSDEDIVTNVKVRSLNNNPIKELDVVFTKDNRLYIVECKSGYNPKEMNMGKLIKEVSGVRDSLKSLKANSILYVLGKGKDSKTEQDWQTSANEFKVKLFTEDAILAGECVDFV